MRVKNNVEYHLEGLVKILLVGEKVYNRMGKELVITSLMEGKHKRNSKHYIGDAADFRTWYFTPPEMLDVVEQLRNLLGGDYDVVLEPDHIHVEYDPK